MEGFITLIILAFWVAVFFGLFIACAYLILLIDGEPPPGWYIRWRDNRRARRAIIRESRRRIREADKRKQKAIRELHAVMKGK